MLEIKKTEDGSVTLYNPELDEHYHSIHGAMTESKHVFVEAGLKAIKCRAMNVFEMGFGTGLNAMLTAQWAQQHSQKVNYHSVEREPLPEELWQRLCYADTGHEELFRSLHACAWEQETVILPEFNLTKRKQDLRKLSMPFNFYHVVFFDAFGPDKQPELWTQEVFEKMWMAMAPGGVLVTYSAKGAVRRAMEKVDFQVERLPGPPGKREMLRAWK